MRAMSSSLVAGAVLMILVSPAAAEIRQVWSENGPQDPLTVQGRVHELGNLPPFPEDEWIYTYWYETDYRPCQEQPDDPSIPNIVVGMVNMTTIAWRGLHYVSDPETGLQNFDGWVDEVGFNDPQEAFIIDWVGKNTPLIFESIAANTIFEPGETWEFVIQDYTNAFGLPASAMASIGVASVSAGDQNSSGSVITPEPGTLAALAIGGLLLVRRRR